MTVDELVSIFENTSGEYMQFQKVEPKRSLRPDLHAFLLLDSLVPGTTDMVDTTDHDEFWLDVKLEELAAVITKDQIIELLRCGVMWTDVDRLGMTT